MLRKLNIKIMLVIICSAALFLYGVVGASGGDEPMKVQEVGNGGDDGTLFIAGVSLLISLGSLGFTVWWTLRGQKKWEKEKMEIQHKYEKEKIDRQLEKQFEYNDKLERKKVLRDKFGFINDVIAEEFKK